MILEEFKVNQNRKWRKKVYKSALKVSVVILAIELLTFISYIFMGSIDTSYGKYIMIRVCIPSIINFGSILLYKILEKKNNVKDHTKNYMLVAVMLIMCTVVSSFHGFYLILWIAPTVAIFYSTLFNSENLLRYVLTGSAVEVSLAFIIGIVEDDFELKLLFSYLVVSLFLIACEYMVAKKIVEHNKEQRKILYAELDKQNELIERLDLEPMTKLYNKKTFERHIEECIEHSIRDNIYGEKRYFIMMLDLDHFKTVNDTYGHLSGDKVLLKLAAILQKYTAGRGKAYRYGGEEFVVILDPCKAVDAYSIAEQIRRILKEEVFDFDKERKITTSIGVVNYVRGYSSRDWIEMADKLLYMAKKNGRNQVVIEPKLNFKGMLD